MKRDGNKEIIYERLGVFEIISHQISVVNNIDIRWECIYEHVNVFTDKNNPIIAFKFCNSGKIIGFDLSKESDNTVTILKDNHKYIQEQIKIINHQFNAHQNCLGFCLLDGELWINLLPENLNKIFLDDNYIETQDVTNNHLIIYYENNLPIHISKYNSEDNRFEHKIGCNTHRLETTNDISKIYKYDTIRFYIKEE